MSVIGPEAWSESDALAALLTREPLFHRREFVFDEASFDAEIAPDFFEIGASGAVYTREFVRETVLARLAGVASDSLAGGFLVADAATREVASGLWQITYTLHGQGRLTRRSTVYRRTKTGWQAASIRARWSPSPPADPAHRAQGGATRREGRLASR